MGNKRVASAEGPSAVPNKRTKRAKNPRDSMHKALDNFKRFPDKPDYEDHQEEQALYKALSHKTQDLRVKGAVAISKALIGQSGDEEPVAPTISEEELTRHMEAYLFPALSQGHAVSREGTFRVLSKVFAALIGDRALTASQYPSLTFDQLLEMLVRHTPLDDESAAGEDQELGRLLGVQCLAQPEILSKDAQRWKELLPLLLELAVKNLELQLACGSIIANVVETLDKTDATLTTNAVSESSIANTPEGLAIWVAALTQHPDLKSKTWKKPVSTKSSPRLTSILKESATKVLNENGPGSDNGKITWTAPLHFVWSKLAAHFGSVGDDALRDFTSLWNPIVEEHLFARNATDLQKARGFLIFQQMLKGVAEHKVLTTTLFSRNLMSCLQNHASRKDRHLHSLAIETLSLIDSVAAAEPKSILPIMEGLLGPNGNYDFEPRTKTKVVEKILKHTRAEDVKTVMTLLETPFKKSSGAKDRLSAYGNAYVLYLYYLGSSGAAPALEKLCLLAFSGPEVRSKYGMSDSSKSTCKTHLESAFAKSSRSTGDYDGICRAVASMKPDSVVELDEEVAAEQKVALKSLKSLMKGKDASAEDKKLSQAVALIHAVALFQIYSLSAGAEALLTGVNAFYETYKSGEEEDAWQLLIVKVLLPMVHRPSSLGRLVSKYVFECFAPKLDLEAMQVLVERLEFTEDMAGYSDLLGDINAEGDSDDEEEGSGSDAGSDEEEEDGESDEDSDGGDDNDQSALLKALGSHLIDIDAQKTENGKKEQQTAKKVEKQAKKDAEAEESDSGSDEDMTDSEMMAINDTLVTAFDNITNTGPESKEAKEAKTFVTNFKGRIVDLVEAYLHNQPGQAGVVFPILPDLVRFVARTTSSDLRVRVVEILAKYRKRFVKDRKKWLEEGTGKDVKENLAVLEQIHEEMGSRDSVKFAKGASSACLVVAAAVVAMDRDKIGELNRMHEKLEGEMKRRKRKVHKSFFETWKAYQQSVCNGMEETEA